MAIQTALDSISNSTSGSPFGFKNRIINGAMVIDQRNAGAAITSNNGGVYTLDRWLVEDGTVSGVLSAQQVSDAPAGFVNSLRVTATTGSGAIGTGEYTVITQFIEGFNTADFGFGTASASSVTASFWVKATTTGTYSCTLYNNGASRLNPQPFTINAANTWEYKTVAFAGDTTGTWLTNNGRGVVFNIYPTIGTALQASPGWNGSSKFGVTDSTNAFVSTNNTFFLTGVQLEKGSTATSFDYRPYVVETSLCYRYYYKSPQYSTYSPVGVGRAWATTNGNAPFYLPVPMRSNQTITYSSLSHFDVVTLGNPTAIQNDGAGPNNVKVGWQKSGMSSGTLYQFEYGNTTDGWLAFSAEL
jgi:hypothetical protein